MNPNAVTKDGLYPVAREDERRLPKGWTWPTTRARWTGEKRPPHRGEWYLSGAIVEAWRAPNDLSQQFHIAELVHGELRLVFDENKED